MSQALIPQLLRADAHPLWKYLAWALGVFLMYLLSQVTLPLPWTAVPITGQTFGVAFLSLMLGARLAVPVVATYLFLGGVGVPVFAAGAAGLAWGPTFGYLIGMLGAALVVGRLADRGWGRTFGHALGAAYIGSIIIFASGLTVLSYFVPREALLEAGLFPFLIGDFCKNLMAASLASGISPRRS